MRIVISIIHIIFPDRKDGIAITSEGIGDYSNGSVSTVKKNKFNLISFNKENHLGHIYQYITLLLGMKLVIMNIKLWVLHLMRQIMKFQNVIKF